jgi:hypothetical protein
MSLNLNQINLDDTVAQLVEKLNSNFITISKSNGGPEGKKGNSGTGGLPGARGIMGNTGPKGERGTKWFVSNNTSSFPVDSISSLGDYAIIKNTLDFYEKIGSGNGGWTKRGTFNLTKDFTIDLENVSYLIDDSVANTSLDILINAKTNHTILLTNIDRPDEDLPPQIPIYDSPGDSYPLIQKGVSSLTDLFDYKLKIYNSGDSVSSTNQIYGRNLHLANSHAMLKKEGWANSSGFTFSSDLAADSGSQGTNGVGIEILRLRGESSGNVNHLHRVQVENSDLWVSSFRIFKDGTATIGHNGNSYLPTQKIDINGAIRIGTTSVGVAGSIRYSNLGFEGHDGEDWVKLDYNYLDFLDSVRINPDAFNNLLIDTSEDGGVIVGDFSGYLDDLKAGAIRFNRTLNDFEGYDGTKWLTLNNKLTLSTDVGTGGNGGNNSGGGGTVTTPDGDPISLKFSVSVDSAVVGTPQFEGIVVTSDDGSLNITKDIIDSKYAVLDFSVNSGLGFVDSKGNPIKISELDITSDDITINKRIEDEKLTYELTLEKTDLLKELVADSIDLRNTDGSIKIIPPGINSYWELGLTDAVKQSGLGGGSGSGFGSGVKTSAFKYDNGSSNITLSYSNTFLGHVQYLPFPIKDFDENCNVVSNNPLEVSVNQDQSGVYNISSRVRFKITSSSGGTFNSVKLGVFKENVLVSILETVGLNDITYQTLSSSKVFELAGSDLIDMSCLTGNCSDKIKLGLIATYDGLTSGNVSVTIDESRVAINRVTSITKDGLENALGTSTLFFKEVELVDGSGDPLSPVSKVLSTSTDATLKINSETDYLDISLVSGVLNIEANIFRIAEEIDPDSNILNPSYSKFIIDGFEHDASDSTSFEFAGGDNIDLSLTGNVLTINSTKTQISGVSGSDNFSNVTILNFDGDDFVVTKTEPNTLNITLPPSVKNSNKATHLYTKYEPLNVTYDDIPSQISEDGIKDGVLKTYDDNMACSILYTGETIDTNVYDETIGTFYDDSILTESVIFTPSETARYEISNMLNFQPMIITKAIPQFEIQHSLSTVYVTIGIFKKDVTGSIKISNGVEDTQATLISYLGGGSFTPKISPIFVEAPFFESVGGTTILELEENEKYFMGVMTFNKVIFNGADYLSDVAWISTIKVPNTQTVKSLSTGDCRVAVFLHGYDLTIKKL